MVSSDCLSVCLSVCDLSCGRNSQSILVKFCTVVWNPKSKIEFQIRPLLQSFPISPNFYTRRPNAFLMARFEHHSNEACGQIMAFDSSNDASRRPLYWQYYFKICCNFMLLGLAVNAKFNFSVIPVFQIGSSDIVLS